MGITSAATKVEGQNTMHSLKDWHKEAVQLNKLGYSSRQIARALGKGKTSVNDLLSKLDGSFYGWKAEGVAAVVEEYKGPKILFLDIETFAMQLAGWGLFNQNFSIDQIKEDWKLLSFCSKWGHSEEITYQAADEYTEVEMLTTLWKFLDEAQYVVGHNSKRFDVKRIFAKLLTHGFDRPSPFRQIDTLEISKRNFGMTSNKLAFLTRTLCTEYVKADHGKFAGFELWRQCALGNPDAFVELRHYNILDVLSLEELYGILAKWDLKLPVFEVHEEGIADMSDWEPCGLVYSNLGKFECYRNKNTKQYRRSRKNLLTKEQRQVLLANIV